MGDPLLDWLGGLSGPVVYAAVATLVFAEDALFLGFVLPGETAVLLGGVLAGQGKVSVYWLGLVVVLAAVAGDSVGYQVGRHFGSTIVTARPLRRHQDRVAQAQNLIHRWGPAGVFLGRFFAFFRATMPALAGISHMRYRQFLLFNVLGGMLWGVGYTLLGYFAGAAYRQVEKIAGSVVAALLAAIVVTALVIWHLRRRRAGAPGGRGSPH
ncbi:DedA family protein [Sphaerimonospora cavernae]|uniref:DedA family protein n=1 Tax=Sphaerimonospora cavernae TaxID=1740611 RepID=A0ABV6U195_9ACTN